ncbi:hypothetical protein ACHQM5_023652 [Ranunculus cassubicifolius]
MYPRPLTRSSKPGGNSDSAEPTGVLHTQKKGNSDDSSIASLPKAIYTTDFVSLWSSHSFICTHFSLFSSSR